MFTLITWLISFFIAAYVLYLAASIAIYFIKKAVVKAQDINAVAKTMEKTTEMATAEDVAEEPWTDETIIATLTSLIETYGMISDNNEAKTLVNRLYRLVNTAPVIKETDTSL